MGSPVVDETISLARGGAALVAFGKAGDQFGQENGG